MQKASLTNFNFLIVQDLWQAYYQIFLMILLKEFMKLNAKMDMIKNPEECGKNTKHSAHSNDDKLCMRMVESMHLTDLSLIYAKLSIF